MEEKRIYLSAGHSGRVGQMGSEMSDASKRPEGGGLGAWRWLGRWVGSGRRRGSRGGRHAQTHAPAHLRRTHSRVTERGRLPGLSSVDARDPRSGFRPFCPGSHNWLPRLEEGVDAWVDSCVVRGDAASGPHEVLPYRRLSLVRGQRAEPKRTTERPKVFLPTENERQHERQAAEPCRRLS